MELNIFVFQTLKIDCFCQTSRRRAQSAGASARAGRQRTAPDKPRKRPSHVAAITAMSSALESYLLALNALPGVASSSALYEFLGLADVMTSSDWRVLFADTCTVQYTPNTLILCEGQRNDYLFVVERGCVAVERASHRLAVLRRGACFGELTAFLDEPTASATVVALGSTQLDMFVPDDVDDDDDADSGDVNAVDNDLPNFFLHQQSFEESFE